MSLPPLPRRDFLLAAATMPALPALAEASPNPPLARLPRLGLVTYNLAAGWDLDTLLRIAASTGISDVELRTTHAHGVEPELDAAGRAAVRAKFARSSVRLWGLGTVCEFHSPDSQVVEANIERCLRFLDLAADLGAQGVKVRPNGLLKQVPVEATLSQIAKALKRCGVAAAERKLEVWVEVHGAGTAEPKHMKAILEACAHPKVGITWNSNPQDVSDGSVRPAFDLLRPWLRSVHINQLFGPYPYRELFQLLLAAGYDRPTLIELPQKLDPAAGELLLRYYKALWLELQR